jgi:hypothetical protein
MSADIPVEVTHPDSAQRYRLISRLGVGSVGEVWAGSTDWNGRIAIKVAIASGHPDESGWWSRCGAAVASLSLPGLVRVHEAFISGAPQRPGATAPPGYFRYLVMDLVDGQPLDQYAGGSPIDRLSMLAPVAAALDALHGFPLAHGDVKPGNILVRPGGAAVLVDVGRFDLAGPRARTPFGAPELFSPPAPQPTLSTDAYGFAATAAQLVTGQALPTDTSGLLDLGTLADRLRTGIGDVADHLLPALAAAPDSRPAALQPWLTQLIGALATRRGAEAALDDATPLTLAPAPALVPETEPPSAEPEAPMAEREAILVEPVAAKPLLATAPEPPANTGPAPEPPSASPERPAAAPTPADEPAPGRRGSKRTWIVAGAAALLVFAGAGTTYALTSGGDPKPKPHALAVTPERGASTPSQIPSAKPVSSDVAVSSTPPTDTAVAPSGAPTLRQIAPGDAALSSDDLNAACDGAASIQQLLPGAVALLACTDSDGNSNGAAAVDIRTGAVRWTRPDIPGSAGSSDVGDGVSDILLSGGGRYLYVLTVTDHPADGLKEEYWTRTVTAVDVATGKDTWTAPLERHDRTDSNVSGSVTEEALPDGGTAAVVNVDDYSGYDATTGKLLWERPDLSTATSNDPILAGYDRTLDTVSDDNGNQWLVCVDLQTGKRAWRTRISGDSGNIGDNSNVELDGTTFWFLNDGAADGFDLVTGKRVAHSSVPKSFDTYLVTPKWTVAQAGQTLRLYHTGQWSKPVWSVASDSATPDLVTSKIVVVDAQAGTQVLDAATGELLNPAAPFDHSNVGPGDVVDGFVVMDDAIVAVGAR